VTKLTVNSWPDEPITQWVELFFLTELPEIMCQAIVSRRRNGDDTRQEPHRVEAGFMEIKEDYKSFVSSRLIFEKFQ